MPPKKADVKKYKTYTFKDIEAKDIFNTKDDESDIDAFNYGKMNFNENLFSIENDKILINNKNEPLNPKGFNNKTLTSVNVEPITLYEGDRLNLYIINSRYRKHYLDSYYKNNYTTDDLSFKISSFVVRIDGYLQLYNFTNIYYFKQCIYDKDKGELLMEKSIRFIEGIIDPLDYFSFLSNKDSNDFMEIRYLYTISENSNYIAERIQRPIKYVKKHAHQIYYDFQEHKFFCYYSNKDDVDLTPQNKDESDLTLQDESDLTLHDKSDVESDVSPLDETDLIPLDEADLTPQNIELN